MKFALDDYIDKYIKEADDTDKTVAQHLKEIIPQTTHLHQDTFKEIIEQLKKEMNNRNRDDVIKRFPVFTDAGWYDKFYPSHKNDQYGRTKPLDESSRGMPEIVHVNLKLADIIEDIRFLEE